MDIERQQIELVFCLGGGELDDEGAHGFTYTYDGVPSYMTPPDDLYAPGVTYWTAVYCELYGQAKTPEGHERIAHFTSSGETQCECGHDLSPDGPGQDCPLCEGDGLVYIGDGWREIVFRECSKRCESCDEYKPSAEVIGLPGDPNSAEWCAECRAETCGYCGESTEDCPRTQANPSCAPLGPCPTCGGRMGAPHVIETERGPLMGCSYVCVRELALEVAAREEIRR